jgi:serine protease Do
MQNQQHIKSVIKYSTLSALTVASITSPLLAIERPAPATQPQEIAPSSQAFQPMPEAQKSTRIPKAIPIPIPQVADNNPAIQFNKNAYLGVFGEPISDTITAHLNLIEGIGLELELVAPNSPAAQADLKKSDIILSVAGKDISTIEDLRASIADRAPGDQVELKYITGGKAVSKNITLAARPTPQINNQLVPNGLQERQQALSNLGLPKEFLDKFPQQDREKLMKLFNGNLHGLDLQELQKGLDKNEGFNLNLQPKGLNPKINKGLQFRGSFQSRIKMVDNDGSITLESTKDGKVIELLDKTGKLQYHGPYNNEADRQSIPKELRSRVENLDIENELGFFK